MKALKSGVLASVVGVIALFFGFKASENASSTLATAARLDSLLKTENTYNPVVLNQNIEKQERSFHNFQDVSHLLDSKLESYSINNNRDTTLISVYGNTLNIPSNAFIDENGQPVSGQVSFRLKEYENTSEIIAADLSTLTDKNEILETGGMYHTEAFSKAGKLNLAPGKSITLNSRISRSEDFKTFEGLKSANETIIRKEAVLPRSAGAVVKKKPFKFWNIKVYECDYTRWVVNFVRFANKKINAVPGPSKLPEGEYTCTVGFIIDDSRIKSILLLSGDSAKMYPCLIPITEAFSAKNADYDRFFTSESNNLNLQVTKFTITKRKNKTVIQLPSLYDDVSGPTNKDLRTSVAKWVNNRYSSFNNLIDYSSMRG